ncbi:hypothetical protein [Pseudomonas sp. WAC2]|uniref:hypothetical protein n=1 Tax=Pseudomonas sp. WAC2 TaxID=3055057 RepID=UPI0025B100EC|nr:hypothetical protein [Pseudomonas sp. WAC2]MDN3237997.1 hypothetical protein [Pseudomonas sp. WAC2]
MDRWNLEETREHIARLYGRHQLELAKPCIQSVVDRQVYARIHYQDARSKTDIYIRSELQETSLLEVAFGDRGKAWEEFNIFVREVGAHLTACIQSMHALPDILAHAIYYSLGLNISSAALKSRNIGAASVSKLLKANIELVILGDLLIEFIKGGNFVHLSALSNQAKHRSIVFPSLSEDWTGKRKEPHLLIFPAFSYESFCYPQVSADEFLKDEYQRCSELVVEIGSLLNAVLCKRKP